MISRGRTPYVRRSGIDEQDRARFDQPEDRAFTFRFGLERLALGVTMSDDSDLFGQVAPFDELEGGSAALCRRFSAYCAALFQAVSSLRAPRPLRAYTTEARAMLDALTSVSAQATTLREQIDDELGALDQQATTTGFEGGIELGALRAALAGRFDGPRAGDRPITGGVSVCALSPMRSLPFRGCPTDRRRWCRTISSIRRSPAHPRASRWPAQLASFGRL